MNKQTQLEKDVEKGEHIARFMNTYGREAINKIRARLLEELLLADPADVALTQKMLYQLKILGEFEAELVTAIHTGESSLTMIRSQFRTEREHF